MKYNLLAWDQIQNVSSFDNSDQKIDPGMALDVQLRSGYVGLERMFRDYEYVAFRRTLEFPFWVSSRIGRGREWSQLTYFRTNWPTYSPKCKDPDNDQQLCNAPTLKWSRVIKQIQYKTYKNKRYFGRSRLQILDCNFDITMLVENFFLTKNDSIYNFCRAYVYGNSILKDFMCQTFVRFYWNSNFSIQPFIVLIIESWRNTYSTVTLSKKKHSL